MKWQYIICCIVLLFLADICLYADEWSELAKKARQAFPTDNSQEKLDIVQKLVSFNKREVVDLLISALEKLEPILKKLGAELEDLRKQPLTRQRQADQSRVMSKIIDEERLKNAVADALSKINDPQAIKTMLQKLSHRLAMVRIAVARGLIMSGAEEGISAIKTRLEKDEKETTVKINIYDEIAKKKSKKFISLLAAGLNSDIWQIQITSADGLAEISSNNIILPLIEGLKGKDGRVKIRITEILKSKTGIDKGEDSLAWKMWWENEGKAKFPS